MRTAISLLMLLLSMCGAQTRSTQPEVQTERQGTGAAAEVSTQDVSTQDVSTQDVSTQDVSAELKELRDMVVQLKTTLQYTQNEVMVLRAVNEKVQGRLMASETKIQILDNALQDAKAEMKMEVDNLKNENAAHEVELAVLKTQLAATEAEVQDLKKDSAAHEQELAVLKTRLAATETEVENLEIEIKPAPKVAFSAGLGSNVDAGANDLNLVFSSVITNEGQAYNSANGFFTAPVRGVYYFRFTVMDFDSSRDMIINMQKNGLLFMHLYDSKTDNRLHSYLSGGLALQLEKGDAVNLMIEAGYGLYGGSFHMSSFSGFLLFPL